MPPRRGRPRKGDRRIDAAIDHFTAMGYAEGDIRAVVADLLKLYGGPDAWYLLEEGSYDVVQNKLFEKEDEEKQKQDQPLLLEHQQVEDEPPQHQELAADDVPRGNSMSISEVHNEVPAQTESADEELEDPMIMEPLALESFAQLSAAVTTGYTRRPCYGWLSESEDEEEEQHTRQRHEVHVPSPEEGLLCKRMRVQ